MFALIFLLLSGAPSGAKEIPADVTNRLSYLIRAEAETQLKAAGVSGSEEAAFDTADRRLTLMEESLQTISSQKLNKFTRLIEFFREKMIHKCCQLSGKSTDRGFKGGGGGGGRGRGRGGG